MLLIILILLLLFGGGGGYYAYGAARRNRYRRYRADHPRHNAPLGTPAALLAHPPKPLPPAFNVRKSGLPYQPG